MYKFQKEHKWGQVLQETEVMIQVLMDQSLLAAYAEHLSAFERVHRQD